MKKSNGKCRIDGVAIGEISINLLGQAAMVTKYALVNSSTGERFGAGTSSFSFSDATMKKLGELVSSMEQDIIRAIFDGEPSSSEEVVDLPEEIVIPEL